MGEKKIEKIYVLWMSTGLGCDGCSISVTGATNPSIEDVLAGRLPGVPPVVLVHPVLAVEAGEDLIEYYRKAERGELDPFVLVLEGSVPDESIAEKQQGWWAAFGFDKQTYKPITTVEWLKRLAPKAAAVIAIGTCAAWGGIPAARNNPTNAMGLMDLLGKDFKSKLGLPIINVPGCPPQGDNFMKTVALLILAVLGLSPPPELDELGRPVFAYGETNRQGCPRAGFAEEGTYAQEFGAKECLLSLGCWGPVVKCNVNRVGWINGVGGVTNMGGPCIGCTMPGFPDAFSPFYTRQSEHMLSLRFGFLPGSIKKSARLNTMKTKTDKSPRWK
ncbi:hydrogenase expression protein HypE [Sulfolobus sp. E1]|uniref:NADH-quinone oxidoreductase subunit B family protein n=1 Tax=Saccharolobus sp. A20 TaxID=1891280 RepID=UPI0009F1D3C2|nr:hydrogenase expression protein HypE [Sulfolobus sp. A20]TRM76592.1 hydrogenase expression protein HypE [Sulfolobus sp. E5]TRM76993.1 hydrogenase expression protein HypE [Sulfolobus sp. A20-N-F8]TRM78360.1 hydrogenase expression protein HypE [Sulfolobus sp. B5]TRM80909.1 hydrogenase expression protein HypE [Sulfolobus sp. D5]TRM84935.1 hydrogenase expression protein HypE [Sulfolobus sp. F3]TRM88388.1 hydrogenase expression protein HypE [Sulfolobus sp. C3]TRM99697.1 hydrogenase expression p